MKSADTELRDPFRPDRWEFESKHVVWVPPIARQVLGEWPCHIQGVRGSGKTALLKVADYHTRRSQRTRLYNESNVLHRCLGVYVNFVQEFSDFIDAAPGNTSYYDYTILYCTAKALDLIDDASRDGTLDYTYAHERAVVDGLVREFSFATDRYEELTTFQQLASHLRRHCRRIRESALAASLYVEDITQRVDGFEFYSRLCDLLNHHQILYSSGTVYYIKICVDDAHLLSTPAQLKINNILYRSHSPIYWNIAYVEGQFDPTAVDNQMRYITSHDRMMVELNYRDNHADFHEICARIFEIRLGQSSDSNNDGGDFRLADRVGRLKFSDIFNYLVSRSNKGEFLDEFRRYTERLTLLSSSSDTDWYVYKGFLAYCIFSDYDAFEAFVRARSAEQVDNYFRQKVSAALVVAARVLGLPVPYVGLNSMYYLADGCIRDFLVLCSSVHRELLRGRRNPRVSPLLRREPVALEAQSRAFHSGSRQFLAGVQSPRQPFARQLSSLIDGLGWLTHLLQTEDRRISCLLPDRGRFKLLFEDDQSGLFEDFEQQAVEKVRRVIREGVYTGAIRVEHGDLLKAPVVEVRLSGILAPAFGLAPRIPKRSMDLSFASLRELLSLTGEEARLWAARQLETAKQMAFRDIEAELQQLGLFP